MGLLESIRRLFGRAGETLDQAEYAALDAVHGVEDQLDEATGGRFYDAVEKADEEAGELLDRLHLGDELGDGGTADERLGAAGPDDDRPAAA